MSTYLTNIQNDELRKLAQLSAERAAGYCNPNVVFLDFVSRSDYDKWAKEALVRALELMEMIK